MTTLKSTSILASILAQIPHQMRTKLIILSSIAMALVVMAFPTNKFQPKTVWEHYCKYTYLTRINGMNTFLLQVNQTPITTQTQVQPSTSTYVPKTN